MSGHGFDGSCLPACTEEEMTLWLYRGEETEEETGTSSSGTPGAARWKTVHCTAMTERHTAADDSAAAGYPAVCVMTGFLFPTETVPGARGNLPAMLSAGRDCLAAGRWTGTPAEAALAGAEVFSVRDASRPARFSDGRLTDWCHFRAVRVPS